MVKIQHPSTFACALVLGTALIAAGCARDDSYQAERDAGELESDLERAGEDLERAGEDLAEGARRTGAALNREAERLNRELEPRIEDAALVLAVKARLTADPEVNPFEIDVDAVDGVITLGGMVDSEEERAEAEKLARRTEGVSEVINNLQVGRRGAEPL